MFFGFTIYDALNAKRIRNKLLKLFNEYTYPLDIRVYVGVGRNRYSRKCIKFVVDNPYYISSVPRSGTPTWGWGGLKNLHLRAVMGLIIPLPT
jgi:hypothetical protein